VRLALNRVFVEVWSSVGKLVANEADEIFGAYVCWHEIKSPGVEIQKLRTVTAATLLLNYYPLADKSIIKQYAIRYVVPLRSTISVPYHRPEAYGCWVGVQVDGEILNKHLKTKEAATRRHLKTPQTCVENRGDMGGWEAALCTLPRCIAQYPNQTPLRHRERRYRTTTSAH
jgi:hypothetical protein